MMMIRKVVRAIPAEPRFAIGQKVRYVDHHGRPQKGCVTDVEATWRTYGSFANDAVKPHISYTVTHPTYANRRMSLAQTGMEPDND